MSDSVPNLTGATAAVLAGMSERHFRRLVKDGTGPIQAPNGTFPPEPFRAWLRARFADEFGMTADGEQLDSFQAERTRLTRAQADKTEFEAAELAGVLVRTDEVSQAWGEQIASARSKMLPFPSKIAQRIAPPERIVDVQQQAQEMIYEVLNELAGDGLPARTRARRAANRDDLDATAKPDGEPVGRRAPKTQPGIKRRARKVGDGDR